MNVRQEEQLFLDLPEALVEEMLLKCEELGENLSGSFKKLHDEKQSIREILREKDVLKKDTEIFIVASSPTSCGVDGSYAIERLLSTDLVAIASVAIEGLIPPSEVRYWPLPRHFCEVLSIPHYDASTLVSRAVMICMEFELATKAPHDVVMLDGSFTTPVIYLNQALSRINAMTSRLSTLFLERLKITLESLKTVLQSRRSDKIFVGLPKYTTRKEISENILKSSEYEDRVCYHLFLTQENMLDRYK